MPKNGYEIKALKSLTATLNLNADPPGVECLYPCLLAVGVTGGGGGVAEFAAPRMEISKSS